LYFSLNKLQFVKELENTRNNISNFKCSTNETKTAEMINKQICEIEKELMRKAQNDNIKKVCMFHTVFIF